MKWSFKIGQFAGIGVYVHATFFLVIFWVLAQQWSLGTGPAGALRSLALTLAIFGCVVLHEFGHALTAKRYGIRTRDITLLPIGGVARLERMPDEPVQELWVAIAGPLVNVAIAALLWIALGLPRLGTSMLLDETTASPLAFLLRVNLFLAVFNLIPAFPMDGGRILRAFLAMNMDYTRATQVAAGLGQGIAFLFGAAGVFLTPPNPMLLLIAVFVWMGAEQEASFTQIRHALGGVPVVRAMLTNFTSLAPEDTLGQAVDLILSGSQHDFPVVREGEVVGLLRRSDLLRGLAERGRGATVEEVMHRDCPVVEAGELLEQVFLRLQETKCQTLPVVRQGRRLEGIVTLDNVAEFLAIQSALQGKRSIWA